MERDWITLSFPEQRFVDGVDNFLNFAQEHLPGRDKIICPCKNCANIHIPVCYDDVRYDLLKYGFDPTYRVWHFHGECATPMSTEPVQMFQDHHNEVLMDNLDEVHIDQVVQDFDGNYEVSNFQEKMNAVDDGEEAIDNDPSIDFKKNVQEAMTALYPGCEDFTVLTFVIKLYNLKVKHGWSDISFTELLQLFQNVLPSGNKTPKDTYRAKNIIKELSLDYEKIHACPNDCILYWREHHSKTSCPKCGASRYKIELDQKKRGTRVPAKVLRYFPLTQRLQRMYSVSWVAKEMTWHLNGKMNIGKMRHPVDSSTWKHIHIKYKDFSVEPRNVHLALATDGFNPFGTFSTSYSCWPVMCVVYNLPPLLCMKPQFTMLTLLIEGPRQPGNDIDVYLQPLVAELQNLWQNGVLTYDAYKRNTFNMRAILMWTIHDFPAYGNVSGCKTKGRFACPCCGPNTDSSWLHYGKKYAYMGHRRWLSLTNELRKDTRANTFNRKEEPRGKPIRLSGAEVEKTTANLVVHWGKAKAKKRKQRDAKEDEGDNCFYKKSIFFELEYWKHIHVRHNLDVMHIEKNVCEILIALMLNTKGKTKDDANARKDLKRLKIKKQLWLKEQNDKKIQMPSRFWFKKEEKILFLQTLRGLRVPFGFSTNWRNIVTEDGMDLKGIKSHDYHILMQHLLPMLIQHAFRDRKEICSIIRSFSSFFNALCSRVVDLDTLMTLEKGMAKTLCELEKICPPSVFVVMMHLPIHLAKEASACGPVYYRWMYPFERLMKTFKGYVRNKARPEGCIAERYLQEETITYCTEYKGKGKKNLLQKLEKKLDGSNPHPPKLFDNIDDDGNGDESGPVGPGQAFVLQGIEYEQARRWVLSSQPNYDEWQRKHIDFLQRRKVATGKKFGYYKIPIEEEFIPWLQKEQSFIESNDIHFKDIVRGPTCFATRYNKYCVNGFLFVTKDYEENKRNQNSGVCTSCMTTFQSSKKDKSPVNQDTIYYGVLRDIIELEYREGYKPVLFKCDWVKVTQHGVRVDEQANLRLVNLSNLISSNKVDDEPFILAEHAVQVFYSRDPKDPEWHVVLEVPKKIYVEDQICLLSEEHVVSDADVGLNNNEIAIDDELVYSDPDDIGVVVEKTNCRKRLKKH